MDDDLAYSSLLNSKIAVCIADSRDLEANLSFRMRNYTPPYRISCYFVDYNTCRRDQMVSLTVGDHTSKKHHLVGKYFHNGQWVTWEIYKSPEDDIIKLNIVNLMTLNWVLSALMIDPIMDNMNGNNLTINIDDKTRGEWIGRYGTFGGIIFDSVPIVVSSTKEEHVIDILFTISTRVEFNNIYGYDWVKDGRCEISNDAMDNPNYEYGLNIKG